MSAVEMLTDLMNGVRNKYAVQDKLSVSDATNILNESGLRTVIDLDANLSWNNCSYAKTDDGTKVVCSSDDPHGITGFYIFYDKKRIITGKRYSFSALVKGNMEINKVGSEGPHLITLSQKLNPNNWSLLVFNFIAGGDFIFYCKAKKGDWLEIKDMYFSELGGK